jgi:hypothetical protein
VPLVGGNSVVSILITVVLPAPFVPSRPWMAPGAIDKSTASTATRPPNRRVSACSTMAGLTGLVDVGSKIVALPAFAATMLVRLQSSRMRPTRRDESSRRVHVTLGRRLDVTGHHMRAPRAFHDGFLPALRGL